MTNNLQLAQLFIQVILSKNRADELEYKATELKPINNIDFLGFSTHLLANK